MKRKHIKTKRRIRCCFALIATVLIAPLLGWGQTSDDYSGVYYIGSIGYNASTPANNYYLCPTEGWCYYKPVNDFSGDGTTYPNPFLTTYKCKGTNGYDATKAVWTIEKAPNTEYYYIKQTSTGKYMLSNGQINTSTNPDRMRVHLEAVSGELDDKALFSIEPYSTYLTIRIVSPDGINGNRQWLTVNGGNYNYLTGQSGKTGGPTGYVNTAGILGIYTQEDTNAKFYLEPATIAAPTITNNFDGTITITAESGATIYYTIDGTTPTMETSTSGITPVTFTLMEGTQVIKAIAKASSDPFPTIASTYNLPVCARPVITVSNSMATITCATAGASIYYTTNGSQATTSSTPYVSPFNAESVDVIRAIAISPGYLMSNEAYYYPEVEVSSSSEITNMYGHYILLEGFTSSAPIGTAEDPFRGQIDGNYNAFSLNGHALVGVAEDAIIKNVVISSVTYTGSGNVGAIVNTAKGDTKVYNCGIQAGSVSGDTNTGGLVGLVVAGSSVRVVNCYNFANVSGGTYAAGIVGKNEGEVASNKTVGNVRIALCMMYGNVTGATNISPVYCGNHVNNVMNFTEYNYWRYRSGMQYTAYNDQMAIDKDDFLTRFPFYSHILNTHREMAAFFLFGEVACNNAGEISADQIAEIGHWALKKEEADYPIIEPWLTNTKKVLEAPTPSNILSELGTNGYLSVSVEIGTHTYSASLPITDMDEDNFDFTWGKVVLPFANEFEENTDYSKICTGWKITNITGGTEGTFEHYNVSDRYCTQKDLYSTTGFIFAQGGNYIVPYGVTAITIEANFANAFYLSDESYDIAYEKDKTGGNAVSGYVTRTSLAGSTPSTYQGRTVYKTLTAALGAMSASGTTHAQAVVLVGNYHRDDESLVNLTSKGYTIMSIDADNNQEPDYAIYSNNTQDRPAIPPTRFDFVAFIPLGMSSHVTNTKFFPNTPIWKPRGWFEITETGLMYANQFEIDSDNFNTSGSDLRNYRCIINGGYFTQMVRSRQHTCTKLQYYQIGGKVYVKEFYPGNHSANSYANTLVPINVTGGEIEQCFMTGYGKGTAYGPDIYFWCAGGKIHKFLAAYMEKPRQTNNNDGNVNMTAKIDHAIIGRFFGGGTTSNAPITGDINITIDNSVVDFYCGGPEFGDMSPGKTVTTHSTNTTFGEYYGAGFGGTATTYTNDVDDNIPLANILVYPNHFNTYYLSNAFNAGRLCYKAGYGIGNCYKFEFIMHSRGHNGVARFYTGYASFSLATTGTVTNVLDNCTILNSFYGAGCQGMVNGTVTSTLTGCTVLGSAFGGGYKASANEVPVYPTTEPSRSVFTAETAIFSDFGEFPTPDTYTWVQGVAGQSNTADETNKKLYTGTNVTLTDLGNVTGDITITLDGNTTVNGNVFGGGNESKSLGNTLVKILDRTKVFGNIYGGGNMAEVSGNTKVVVNGQNSSNGQGAGSSTNPTND